MGKQIIIRVPQTEYSKINDMLASLTQSIAQKMTQKNKTAVKVKPPRTASTIITYAVRELVKEIGLKNADTKECEEWGRVRLPSWLAANTGVALETITMDIGVASYQQMMAWIKELYPDVYNNKKISNDDFIGALGIAYAHRIMAGTVSLSVTIPKKEVIR